MVVRGKNMGDVKVENRAAVLNLLQAQGRMSRKRIAALLNLTPAAITTIVSELIENGLVREAGEAEAPYGSRNVGRREIMVEIDCRDLFAVGVSFGLGSCVISTMDLQGGLLASETMIFDADSGAENIIVRACNFLRRSIQRQESQGKTCVGIGISVRGIVDESHGVCINSYGGWKEENVPVAAIAAEHLSGYEIFLRQNVRALAQTYLFERRNEAIESMIFIKNDTGIGSALVFDHRVYNGHRGTGSEIGHITVDRAGKPCRCGGRGCLETVASCIAIERDIRQIYGPDATPLLWELTDGRLDQVNIGSIISAVEYGDEQVIAIVDRAVRELAMVIRSLIGTLDVQKVILHGQIFHYQYFFEKLKGEINFDQRYPFLNNLMDTTSHVQDLNNKCSPVLAIEAFYERGGRMERNS